MSHRQYTVCLNAVKLLAFALLLAGWSVFASEEKSPPLVNLPKGVRVDRDVAYLPPDRKERADLYFPSKVESNIKWPALVVIHGGGWNDGHRDGRREIEIGGTLAANGYVAMSIDYKLSYGKYAVWPTNLWDCKTAVRWLRKNAAKLGVDPDRIGVVGGSAGGHLAAMLALTQPGDGLDPAEPDSNVSCRVKCCVDMYGIVDVALFHDAKMLGKTVGEAPDIYRRASPITYIRSNSPPILILQGTADKIVNPEQSRIFAAVLDKAGVVHELVLVPGAPHSFDFQPVQRDLRPVVLDFLKEHL